MHSQLKPSKTLDSFTTDIAQGRVIGSRTPSGSLRQGMDVEHQMAIDHNALRMRPLVKPGWARQGIAYGPYNRQNGLTLAVFLLNGHNTSQSGSILQTLKIRALSWALGLPETGRVRWRLLRRFVRWLGSEQPFAIMRKLQYWAANTPERFQPPELNENLAVGWFPSAVPPDPLTQGNAFIVHALGGNNGELRTRIGKQWQPAIQGLQNLQTYYILMLREQGAVYYAASVPQAHGFVPYPFIRPIAIDAFNQDKTIYAAVYQSVLGQIGFMVDTRVYGIHVELLPRFATWYGTAHAADSLRGGGPLQQSQAEVGGTWIVHLGNAERTPVGTQFPTPGWAVLDPGAPSGLVHILLTTAATVVPVSLIWRFQDEAHFWNLHLSAEGVQLRLCKAGMEEIIAVSSEWTLQPNGHYSVQVLDDGQEFSLYCNGDLLFGRWFQDQRLQAATGVGLGTMTANLVRFEYFEAHPRQIPLPPELDLVLSSAGHNT
ncbi:hypothetical protein [Leptolyngbya sp. 7M]|uniref:hypothetical protein n=1 Tax=Leptolyngbya sp. 7M TaxID=2812896 RepID=UPI001B8AC46E|nr:hypothetical protein [Leptolyngbya sp. 7M]QYO62896.1 hypothetical protein JVX88_23175 [Leptolyngbya sp. 7M]